MRSKRRNKARGRSPIATRSSQRFHKAGNNSNPGSPLRGFGSIAFHSAPSSVASVLKYCRSQCNNRLSSRSVINSSNRPGTVDQGSTLSWILCQPYCLRRFSQGGGCDIAQPTHTFWWRHGVKAYQQICNDLGASKTSSIVDRSREAWRRSSNIAPEPGSFSSRRTAPRPPHAFRAAGSPRVSSSTGCSLSTAFEPSPRTTGMISATAPATTWLSARQLHPRRPTRAKIRPARPPAQALRAGRATRSPHAASAHRQGGVWCTRAAG
jgi:hypothetical protein